MHINSVVRQSWLIIFSCNETQYTNSRNKSLCRQMLPIMFTEVSLSAVPQEDAETDLMPGKLSKGYPPVTINL